MSYMALYRKFRPQEFADVKGQEHIVTTLKNQIKADRIGHAYLFCGTRGTGKTTIAKIFAKAVNCEHPVDGSPCGECASCKAIAAGSSMNVIEIDAASNNGVENIRQIREEVAAVFGGVDVLEQRYVIPGIMHDGFDSSEHFRIEPASDLFIHQHRHTVRLTRFQRCRGT